MYYQQCKIFRALDVTIIFSSIISDIGSIREFSNAFTPILYIHPFVKIIDSFPVTPLYRISLYLCYSYMGIEQIASGNETWVRKIDYTMINLYVLEKIILFVEISKKCYINYFIYINFRDKNDYYFSYILNFSRIMS